MITEDTVISNIAQGNCCLFFGAGISRGVGLPLGNELGSMILEALGVSNYEAQELANKYHLERMLFYLKAVLGQSIHQAYLALSCATYGQNHLILSVLNSEKKIPLITTNQDELIEKAGKGKHLQTVFIKLHGTISDTDSLCVTLDRVSNLSPTTRDRLQRVTEGRTIIVLGYSFSDFDLRDFFQSHADRLYYCAFNGEQNKFLYENVWGSNQQIYDEHCFNSSAETFLIKLAKAYNISIPCSVQEASQQTVKETMKSHLFNWATNYPRYQCDLAVGRLPQGLWQGKKSLQIMEKICSDEQIPPFFRAIAFTEAANAAHGQAAYNKELQFVSKLENILGLGGHIIAMLRSLYRAAHHHIQDNPFDWTLGLRQYRRAKYYFPLALQDATDDNHNLILTTYEKHIDLGIASSLEKLCRFAFKKKFIKESLSSIEPYIDKTKPCDIDFLCEALFVRAKLHVHLKKIEKAENDYKRALDIAHWIKKYHSIDQALRGLGRIYAIKRDFSKARTFLLRSYDVASATHEPILVARNHLTQAWL